MAPSHRARRGSVVTVAALAVAVLPCAPAAWAEATPRPGASPSPTGSTPGPTVPSAAEVAKAKAAAAAAAKEVADITAQVAKAEARLEVLQRGVADAVTAQEEAQQQLAAAEASLLRATANLATAKLVRANADRSLSATAAQLYMQGSDLQDLTTLVLAPPNVMSDLAMVMDTNAHRVRDDLDAATSAAQDAATQERLLGSARDARDLAATEALSTLDAAKKEADLAGAEAATLGQKQEELTARLAVLEQGAADLEGLREAAARLDGTSLLGVQASGGAPRAAQEIARTKMASYGWDAGEFTCLVGLWNAESGWSWSATNPSSGAYGIPQALPGWKMASAGSDWLTNPATQISWGMGYIRSVYGSPCKAYERFRSRSPHWY
jgi:peptidoglycan DL-endopeptidase CwlO